MNNLTSHLKELEKEQTKLKVRKRKGIITIREEINKIEILKMGGKINKTKNWFFERVEKIDKLLAMLPKKESKNPSKQNKK